MQDTTGLTQDQLNSLGTDIAWTGTSVQFLDAYLSEGDLVIRPITDPNTGAVLGDVDTVSGLDNLNASLGRILVTPLYTLGRFIADINSVRAVDFDYGVGIYQALSEPITEVGVVATLIKDSISRDPRVTNVAVRASIIRPENATVDFEVSYTIPSLVTNTSVVLTYNGTTLTGNF